MKKANYNKERFSEFKKSSIYRLFRPLTADYDTKENEFVNRGSGNSYNPTNGRFPLHTNNYSDHEN